MARSHRSPTPGAPPSGERHGRLVLTALRLLGLLHQVSERGRSLQAGNYLLQMRRRLL